MSKNTSNAPAGAIADAPNGTPRLQDVDLLNRAKNWAAFQRAQRRVITADLIDALAARIREIEAEREDKRAYAPEDISQHKWEPSRLGHGESMCGKCFITNREAALLGEMNCPKPDLIPTKEGE